MRSVLVNAWRNDIEPVPEDIVAWLDQLAKAHAKAEIPQNYKGVHLKMQIAMSEIPKPAYPDHMEKAPAGLFEHD
jgi:hypothetical protein